MVLNGLVTNIRALGDNMAESYVVKKVLRAMPNRFLQITSAIEQFGDLGKMTMEEVIGSLKAHDERVRGQVETTGSASANQLLLTEDEWRKREKEESKLLLTRDEWLKRSNRNDGGFQKYRGKGDTRGFRDKSKVRCWNCQGYGHFAADCKKPKRDKESREEANIAQIPDDEPALLLAEKQDDEGTVMLLNEDKVSPKLSQGGGENKFVSNLWYLDNGASNHMTGQRSKFKDLDENVTGQVKFGDGSIVHIKGKGSVAIKCKTGEERILQQVYYIPSLQSNIISLGQLSEDGYKIILSGEHLWVRDKRDKLLMKVKRSFNRLYKIILEPFEYSYLLSEENSAEWLWHSRLGHVNFNAMVQMASKEMVHGLPKLSHPKQVCTGCLMSKQVKKAYPQQSNYSAKKVLELVHGDLCGPITPSTKGGCKYVFLLVDDYSRVMWAYLLKSKDEAFETFKKFQARVEDGQEREIRAFRTDRGGEFLSKEFIEYCEKNGITRQFTSPYSPPTKWGYGTEE